MRQAANQDGARYLLRFDDLCPTMDAGRWEWFERLIDRFGIKPILAVVPANEDPELRVAAEDVGFWERMRRLEAAGAAIGLHGYRHLCRAEGRGMQRGLVPLHRWTEFAGASEADQRAWIRAGLAILRERGLDPQVWVAPRHGLDAVTLRVLREVGIGVVSDGLARRPFRQGGLVWLPQQLWGPVGKQDGLWTICLHSNTAGEDVARELEGFLERFAARFTSVEAVMREWEVDERSMGDRLFSVWVLGKRSIHKGK